MDGPGEHGDAQSTMRPVRTSEYMSRFEFAKLVGFRMMQLAKDIHQESNPLERAEEDVVYGRLKWFIRRRLPGGNFEDCDIRLLKMPHEVMLDHEYRRAVAVHRTATHE